MKVNRLWISFLFPISLVWIHSNHEKYESREQIILEDFEDEQVGKLPKGWKWRDGDKEKEKPYRVLEEEGNKFLRAEDTGQSVILGKEIKWNIRKYPYISWRWRIRAVPEGGDERSGNSGDSAAGLYVTYSKELGVIPKSVKFIWSSSLQEGSALRRNGKGRPWMIVVGSGSDSLNVWHTYVVNVLESYRQTFGGKPQEIAIGIGVLSDANSTDSNAFADYDDIVALKKASETHTITQFLKAE